MGGFGQAVPRMLSSDGNYNSEKLLCVDKKTQHKKTTQDQDSYRNKTNFLLSTISKARKTRVRATGGLEAVTALAS